MLPSSKRRAIFQSLPLPASNRSAHRTYPYEDKDKDAHKHQTRFNSRRKLIALLLVVVVVVALSSAWALLPPYQRNVRTTQGSKVVARDWGHGVRTQAGGSGGALVDEQGVVTPARTYNETVLVSKPPPPPVPATRAAKLTESDRANVPSQILCPMRNAIEHIWHFFHLVDSLTYPRHLLHLAILVSDTTDGTYTRALELADERQYGRKYRGSRRYGRISVYQKDFAADQQQADDDDGSYAYAGANIGSERHTYEAQVGRRKLLGKSRTWLLTSSLAPEIDWVLWADVDLVDYEPTLIERLMEYAQGSFLPAGTTEGADVVVPNCVWKTYNEMGCGCFFLFSIGLICSEASFADQLFPPGSAYDRNNWVETPESLAMKAALPAHQVLIEGE